MAKEICNSIVFYGWSGDNPLAIWLEMTGEVLGAVDVTPNWAQIGNSIEKAQLKPYSELVAEVVGGKHSKAKVAQVLFTIPNYKQLAFGWRVNAGFKTSPRHVIDFYWVESLFPWRMSWIERFFVDAASLLGATYGIAYQRSFDRGPDFYAYGIASGLGFDKEGRSEAHEIGAWMRHSIANSNMCPDKLRDVYAVNLLTGPQMNLLVGSTTLSDWIEHSPKRGILTKTSNAGALWTVPGESQAEVRRVLAESGMLIATA